MPLTQIKTSNLDSTNPLPFRNRLINGGMAIDQRNSGSAFTHGGSQVYNVDRWIGQNSTDGTLTAQRVTDAPTGFTHSLKYTATATDTSLAATQYAFTLQKIEGFNVVDLAFGTASAQTVTISFWAKSSLTGTFSGVLCNLNFDRSYSYTYTINSANTWEYKTVTIPGDTTGTWQTDNQGSFQVIWSLGSGSTYTTTPNTWTAAGSIAATGQVNVMNTLNATWQITGAQLEVGTAATAFERRPYTIELQLCQRYFELLTETYKCLQIPYGYTTYAAGNWRFAVPKRANPTVGDARSITGATWTNALDQFGQGAFTPTSVQADSASQYDCRIALIVAGTSWASGTTHGDMISLQKAGLFYATAEI
jgi:hypothetical protein